MDGLPISPGSLPTEKEMNIKKYNVAHGVHVEWEEWVKLHEEGAAKGHVEDDEYLLTPSDLLQCTYFCRRMSLPSVELWFDVDPFGNHPSSAGRLTELDRKEQREF